MIWRCKTCDKRISVRDGTWFSDSKLTYYQILSVTFCFINGASQVSARGFTSLSHKTICKWYEHVKIKRKVFILLIRYADMRFHCWEIIIQTRKKIGGTGIVVELDEAYFGASKYNRGRKRPGFWVFGGIERLNKKNCFFFAVLKRDCNTLESIIKK